MDAPRIEFPCDYPIKIVGENRDAFTETVVALTRQHAPEVSAERISVRASRAGNYCAVTIVIRATGPEQLDALHRTLRAFPPVRLVL